MELRAIGFPEMFTTTSTRVIKDSEANLNNIKLLLMSCKNSLLGDPYFGTSLKKFIHEQNNVVLQDLIIDEIYVAIKTFIPQVFVKRKDIVIRLDGTAVYATINCINKLDNVSNMYDIKLLTE